MRAALNEAGFTSPVPKDRLKQYVTRENRKCRGGKQVGQKPVVQELLEAVEAWSRRQAATFSSAALEEL